MIERLEYKFIEPADKRNRAIFEADMPAELFDATYANGRLHHELRTTWDKTVIARRFNPRGGLTLGFVYSGMVGDWRSRLRSILTVVSELDVAAAKKGISDPRISITEPLQEYYGDFGFSFERPVGDETTVTDKLSAGMVRAAAFLQGHISKEQASQSVDVTYDPELGYELHTYGLRSTTLSQQNPPTEGRIHVGGKQDLGSAPGFAISLAGVIAALDPLTERRK